MMVRFFSLWHFAAVKSCCFLWIIAAQKRDLQLQNQTRESWKLAGSCGEKERNQTGRVVQRKRKEIRWGGVHAAKSYFIIRRGRFLSFMMIQFQTISFWFHLQLNPLFYHFSIQSLVQKKSFESGLRTWAKILFAAGIPAFTLNIQMGISWASDIKIKRFKSPDSSTCPRLQLWWRIQGEINSFWITELQPNSAETFSRQDSMFSR